MGYFREYCNKNYVLKQMTTSTVPSICLNDDNACQSQAYEPVIRDFNCMENEIPLLSCS